MVPGERAKRRVLHSITPRARLATTAVTAVSWLRYSVGLMRRNGVYAHAPHTHTRTQSSLELCNKKTASAHGEMRVLLLYFLE